MAYVSDTHNLVQSIKSTIESCVLGQQSLSVSAGDDYITVPDAQYIYADGDYCLIYSQAEETETQAHEVQVMACNETTLWINPIIDHDIPDATIIKRIGTQYLQHIYIGQPPPSLRYPCVLIDADIADDSPFTLGGVSNLTYLVTISIYVDGPDYETAYQDVWTFEKRIEYVLTRKVNPTDCQPIWRVKYLGSQHAQQGILQVIHMTYSYEEVLQRLTWECGILAQTDL